MTFSPEFWLAVAIGSIAFLAGVLVLRRRAGRTRSVGRRSANTPENLRFKCSGCSGKFTHSRRTLSGWEKGERSFFCRACLTRARGTPTSPPSARVRKTPKP